MKLFSIFLLLQLYSTVNYCQSTKDIITTQTGIGLTYNELQEAKVGFKKMSESADYLEYQKNHNFSEVKLERYIRNSAELSILMNLKNV